MHSEQITLVIGSDRDRSQMAADRYAELFAADERRRDRRATLADEGRGPYGIRAVLAHLGRPRRSRARAVRLPQPR